jgi:purine-binding chemotaxis protein CheW
MTDSIKSSTPWDHQGELEVLTFDLTNETFALEAVLVQEIVDLLPETTVPGAMPLVGSIVNFRGKIIPIADLRLAFHLEATDATVDSRIVVIEMKLDGEPIQLGIRTDKVHEVTTLHRQSSEAPPMVGMRWRRDYVRELVRRQDDVVILPDLAVIFHSFVDGGELAARQPSTFH